VKKVIIRSTKEIENWRRNINGEINFIPTMGNLHNGHTKLISTAKNDNSNVNLVSIFINPLQFDNKVDLENYPKTIDNDIKISFSNGADAIFIPSNEDIYPPNNKNFKLEDLVNSANGSPSQLLKNIEILNDFSEEIISKLNYPIKNSLEILEISKLISEKYEIYQQIYLANLIQTIWWRKTKNIGLVKKLENLKYLLRKNIQPRLGWEITFLKIALEDI